MDYNMKLRQISLILNMLKMVNCHRIWFNGQHFIFLFTFTTYSFCTNPHTMHITSGKVILRPWKKDDAEALAILADNKKIFNNLRDGFPQPYTLQNAKEFISHAQQAIDEKLFAITVGDSLIGSCGIMFKKDVYRKNAEIGYFLGEPFWGRGYASDAIKGLRDFIFSQYDIIRVYAEPFADNFASRKALEKSGFILEATFEQNVIKNNLIKDTCIYRCLKEG